MPIFFQHQINENTRLGVWKIEETEEFFKRDVPQHRNVTHPHKRLQHLAGRYLLQFLFPDFPHHLIEIADTRQPFLPDAQYHFSISHCGDYAAAIVSKNKRVGIDIEIPVDKILRIADKFLNDGEKKIFNNQYSTINTQLPTPDSRLLTLLWSSKESVFKWYGNGGVDFKKHIHLQSFSISNNYGRLNAMFIKNNQELVIDYRVFENLVLAWIVN
jgi:phosphopantetheinyl transferase